MVRRPAGFVLLFHFLAAIALFQISGAAHLVGDMVEMAVLGEHHDREAEDGGSDHECPPGCPDCHHVHLGAAPIAGLSAHDMIAVLVADVLVGECPPVERVRPGPSPDAPYRPPRLGPPSA